MQTVSSTPLYFGKNPAWGDFLKAKGQHDVIQMIDLWITQALELAMQHPDFDEAYQHLPTLDFFIANPKEELFLLANLIASHDRSGRRFPMILSHLLTVTHPAQHLAMAPLRYKSVLVELYKQNRRVYAVQDTEQLQAALANINSSINVYTDQEMHGFFAEISLYTFAQMMKISPEALAQSMLGLGLLLQPVLRYGTAGLNKILNMPMNNSNYCYEIAAFWVHLISGFLSKQNTEVLIGILHAESPLLLFGFQGADIRGLSDVFIQQMQGEHWVCLSENAWIDVHLEQNAGLAALEQTLSQGQIQLDQAIQLFNQTFIAEK
ncbi:type VI secretion system protein ImpM [Acinetobacter calcoaceticus]|uniref:Type VI secretion system protein ImpM n=1 Tax=Acinetobacter calcoaceticus TaxID=471 RepID=A0A4V2R0Z0_ACICA|nr:type VI secretion system protein ImpM [Acinetobacter calcoaceticus]